MIVHFDTRKKAEDHLTSNNFRRVSDDFFISNNGPVSARIHPAQGEAVCIYFSEIIRAA